MSSKKRNALIENREIHWRISVSGLAAIVLSVAVFFERGKGFLGNSDRRKGRATMRAAKPSRGLTAIELVVVIAVAGLLAALGMAAICQARVRARRTQCGNNLRQIGLALQAYHGSHGLLPPIAFRSPKSIHFELEGLTARSENYKMSVVSANWAMLLLPHLGEDELANSFDYSLPVTDPVNAKGRMSGVTLMKCPSDTYNRPDNHYQLDLKQGASSTFARGNYALNGGPGAYRDSPGTPWHAISDGLIHKYSAGGKEQEWGSGVAGFNKSFSVQDFENGLSNLVGVEEVRAGIVPADARGVWALGEIGASATWWHGLIGDATGPNARAVRADDTVGCNQAQEEFGEATLVQMGMPCCSYLPDAAQATSRSMHPGGINALLLDGSTRFFSDQVDRNIWHAAHSRESHEITSPAEAEPPADFPTSRQGESIEHGKHGQKEIGPSEKPASFRNSIRLHLVRVPAGKFTMGLPDEGQVQDAPPDVPPHTVRFPVAFYMGAFEVTQGEYERVVGSNPSWHSVTGGGKLEVIGKDRARFPVEQVSWVDAVTFCRRLSALPEEKAAGRTYRLPTEAEWEYCCRAGSTKPFVVPKETEADRTGYNILVGGNRGKPLAEVGSYPPNEFALYDMRGNVWEWCADWYARDSYSQSPRDAPQGPSTGALKVIRGSDWRFTGRACKYDRCHTEPWRANPYVGFRVVCRLAE